MRKKRKTTRVACLAIAAMALTVLGFAGSASAKLTGEFTRFQNCPYTNPEISKCIYSVTEGGEVVLGSKKVPIEKQVILQGAYAKPVEKISKFFEATNGITLSKASQNVPGGLGGIVPESTASPLVKALVKFFFENKLTGLTSTLELAKPASEIKVSEINLTLGEEIALKMPVKLHLENPFLGKSCYIGSSTTPVIFELTTGVTNPVSPNKPITGNTGEVEFINEGEILGLFNNELVDNKWSAPTASGCGGILSFLVNPIINSQLGSTTAGHNSAILKNKIYISTKGAVKGNNEANP